jgi:hypothetical protein
MANAVAKANKNDVTNFDVTALEGIGSGFENVTAKDLLIPRLTILQGLSPQVTQGKPEYDKAAKVGDIYDVGFQERFPDGVTYLPVYYAKNWLEWAPRASGKGLQNIHDSEEIMKKTRKDEKGKNVLDNGNLIVETAQLYGLNVNANFRKTFIPMVSTQMKKVRRLLTLATSEKIARSDGTEFTPPLFYRSYFLTTVPESNNEGNWMGWKIERAKALPEFPNWQQLMHDIKSFRESLADGSVKADIASMEEEARAGGGEVIDNEKGTM